mmetsp:Transcript_104113/g.324611  ORF Transcript_104113/g.324611 Transcript_104113/m.324611 type:complete len:552 (-) Transcript_104113:39-1694(-)
MYDLLHDPTAGSPAIGFTSGFNTFSRGRDPNPLEAVRRNWDDRPRSPQAFPRRSAAPGALPPPTVPSPPTTLPLSAAFEHYDALMGTCTSPATEPLYASTAPAGIVSSAPVAVLPSTGLRQARTLSARALSPVRAASPARRLSTDVVSTEPLCASVVPGSAVLRSRSSSPLRFKAADGWDGAVAKALVEGASAVRAIGPEGSPALSSGAMAAAKLAEPVAHDQAAGHLRVVVPFPIEGSKLGLTVKQLVVAAVTDPRALDFGWALGDRILKVSGVPVANTRALSAALTGALSAWQATGQPIVFDIWRPPGTTAGGGPGGAPAPAGFPTGLLEPQLLQGLGTPPGTMQYVPPNLGSLGGPGTMPAPHFPGGLGGPHQPQGPGGPPGSMRLPQGPGAAMAVPAGGCPTGPQGPQQLQGLGTPPGSMPAPPYPMGPSGPHGPPGPGGPPGSMHRPPYPGGPPHQLQGPGTMPGAAAPPPHGAGPALYGTMEPGANPGHSPMVGNAFHGPGHPFQGPGPASGPGLQDGHHQSHHGPERGRQGSARRAFSKRRAVC